MYIFPIIAGTVQLRWWRNHAQRQDAITIEPTKAISDLGMYARGKNPYFFPLILCRSFWYSNYSRQFRVAPSTWTPVFFCQTASEAPSRHARNANNLSSDCVPLLHRDMCLYLS